MKRLTFTLLMLSALLATGFSPVQLARFGNASLPSGGGGGGSITVDNAWKNSGTTSASVTVSPTAGHALYVVISAYYGSASAQTVSDNIDGSTGWNRVGYIETSGHVSMSQWVKFSVPSGLTTVTAGATDATVSTCIVHEISNATAWTSSEHGEQDTGTSTNPNTTSLSNGTAGSVFFAALGVTSDNSGYTMTINSTGTSGGTWALKNSSNSQETDAANYVATSVPYLIVSSSASRVHGWTIGTPVHSSATMITCFY